MHICILFAYRLLLVFMLYMFAICRASAPRQQEECGPFYLFHLFFTCFFCLICIFLCYLSCIRPRQQEECGPGRPSDNLTNVRSSQPSQSPSPFYCFLYLDNILFFCCYKNCGVLSQLDKCLNQVNRLPGSCKLSIGKTSKKNKILVHVHNLTW